MASHGPTAPLVEIFASIQGEGAFAGEPQSFVRLAGCPLRCLYCDSESTWFAQSHYRVVTPDGDRMHANPATRDGVLRGVIAAESGGAPRTISITGGEPLMHGAFIGHLAPHWRSEGRRVHLETAGVHAGELERLVGCIDHVSADYKCASTMETGDFYNSHREFYRVCGRAGLDVCIKCVVTAEVSGDEVARAASLVAQTCPGALFVLQPVTPLRRISETASHARVDALVEVARRHVPRVRVIPQMHRAMERI
jgi:organic radical activating enzyme